MTVPDAKSTSPRPSVSPTTADIQIAWLAARHAGALALLGDRLTDAALEELELLAADLERRGICGVTIFPTMPELAETLARTGRTGEARDDARHVASPRRGRPVDAQGRDLGPARRALRRVHRRVRRPTSRPPKSCSRRCRTPSSWPGPISIGESGCDAPGAAATRPRRCTRPEPGSKTLGARAWRAQADAELRALGLRPKATDVRQ